MFLKYLSALLDSRLTQNSFEGLLDRAFGGKPVNFSTNLIRKHLGLDVLPMQKEEGGSVYGEIFLTDRKVKPDLETTEKAFLIALQNVRNESPYGMPKIKTIQEGIQGIKNALEALQRDRSDRFSKEKIDFMKEQVETLYLAYVAAEKIYTQTS